MSEQSVKGEIVPKVAEVVALEFSSVEQRERFDKLMSVVQPKVAEALRYWFTCESAQIAYHVASVCVLALLDHEKVEVEQPTKS